jgi:hypothetical protein
MLASYVRQVSGRPTALIAVRIHGGNLFIVYSHAWSGSGKTHQIIQQAVRWVKQGKKVLIAQPTIELIRRTINDEVVSLLDPPKFASFHGEMDLRQTVGKEVADFLSAADEGVIVFITHSTLALLPYFANRNDWYLVVDEDLQILRHDAHTIPDTHTILTDQLEIEQINSIYGLLKPKNRNVLEQKGRNKGDDELLAKLAPTIRIITNRNWESVVNIQQYDNLLRADSKTLSVHSILLPSVLDGYGYIFMAAANFENSALFKLWSKRGVHFKLDQKFNDTLLFNHHDNGELISIYYATEKPWSKSLMNKELGGISNLHRIMRAARDLFGSDDFLFQANVSVEKFIGTDQPVRLPNIAHGLNNYSGFNDVVFLSALNPRPDHIRFLKDQGLTDHEIRAITYYSTVYQSVLRTSIRDRNSTTLKRVVVTDRGVAEFLRELFPGATLHSLDAGIIDFDKNKPGRPKSSKYGSDKERMAAKREELNQKRLALMAGLLDEQYAAKDGCDDNSMEWCSENTIELIDNFRTRLCVGTFYTKKNSATPLCYLASPDNATFIQFLYDCHVRDLPSKMDNPMLSPAIFDPDRIVFDASGKPTKRAKGNIEYLQHVWLDLEHTDIKPDHIAKLFPRIQMVVTNTFSHTEENPRYRVIILTTKRLTADAYEMIFDEIVAKLKDAGFVQEPRPGTSQLRSGLDHSKRSSTSLFLLPCQAQVKDHSFFDVYDGPERKLLDPFVWINNSVSLVPSDFMPFEHEADPQDIDEVKVEAACAKWRMSKHRPGTGNREFFNLAVALRGAGMNATEIGFRLKSEAQFGRHKERRLQQISSILSSLKSSRQPA